MFALILLFVSTSHAGAIKIYDPEKPRDVTFINVKDKDTWFEHGSYKCRAKSIKGRTTLTCIAYDTQVTVVNQCGDMFTINSLMLNGKMVELHCVSPDSVMNFEKKPKHEVCLDGLGCIKASEDHYRYHLEKMKTKLETLGCDALYEKEYKYPLELLKRQDSKN